MNEQQNKPWTEWLLSLTSDESSALLSKLKKMPVKARQRVFQQGECDSRLIFIESGKLKLSYWNALKRKNIVFTELIKGDVCGAESFFSHSPNTGTLAAVENSVIRSLYKTDFHSLHSQYPEIENKLIEYCEKYQKKIVFHDPQKLARREHQRYPTSLKGRIQQVDSSGKKSSRALSVIVSDISIGGVCCKTEKLEAGEAEALFQSHAQIKITYQKTFLSCDVEKLAKVVAVRFRPFGESTIHLQFQIPMTEKEVLKMVQQNNVYTYT
jgi:CRP-like cAMP-binding protein